MLPLSCSAVIYIIIPNACSEWRVSKGLQKAFFFKHLSLSGKIEGLYREEELEIPYKALRECCTNAFCHRLYHRPGSSVGIAIYDDRVEIENSGTFSA